jgi:predicted RNA binding protein YcfA (HicA-like mRNA interferase family)
MTRLPRLAAQEVIRAIERRGFVLVRQSGSHNIFRNSEGTRLTVPFHPGKILHPKLPKSIMVDAQLSVDDLRS